MRSRKVVFFSEQYKKLLGDFCGQFTAIRSARYFLDFMQKVDIVTQNLVNVLIYVSHNKIQTRANKVIQSSLVI